MSCGCIDCFLLYNQTWDQEEKRDPRMELQDFFQDHILGQDLLIGKGKKSGALLTLTQCLNKCPSPQSLFICVIPFCSKCMPVVYISRFFSFHLLPETTLKLSFYQFVKYCISRWYCHIACQKSQIMGVPDKVLV